MNQENNVNDDLSYVRGVVSRAEGESTNPASIYFVWAVLSFFGFAIIDYAPEQTGLFWMIAGPAGGVLSGILGERAARRAGTSSARGGWAEGLHWVSLFAGFLLLIPLVASGGLRSSEIPRVILLLIAINYFTAGIHLDRRMGPIGIVVALSYLLTVFARDLPYLWTITGAIVAASLAAGGGVAALRSRNGSGGRAS